MAGEDKTAALVVALSAQLTKFEKDMKRAGDIADREVNNIEKKFSSMNPGLSNSFFGNLFANIATKGLEQAVKLVGDLVERFIDLEKASKLLQISMNDLFGVQQAAAEFKVPIDQANASIKELATLLNRMQRGEKNTLSDLFDANPQVLKGINRDALTLQQTLEIVQTLLQNANRPLDKIDAGRLAGLTDQFALALGRAGTSFTQVAQKAAETAPDLQKMADAAKQFEELMGKAGETLKQFFVQQSLDFFKSTIKDLEALISLSIKFLGLFKNGPLDEVTSNAADKLRGLGDTISNAGKSTDGLVRVPVTGGTQGRGSTNIPVKGTGGGGDVQDSFDRTEESITRHTASVKADTIAVSENSSVQAQLRAEFQLLNAIRKDEGEVTQAQIDQYTKLRGEMSAELALEQAKINLTPAHKASFIAASEGAATATAAYTKAADSVAKLNSVSSTLGSAFSTAFSDAIVEGKKLNEVFSSLIKTLEKAAINSLFASFFNQQAGGGLSPFASLFKGSIPGFATGTNFAPGGMAWVGEHGKELVNLPRGSQVMSSAESRRAMSGSTISNTFMVSGDVSPDTISRLQAAVIAANKKADTLAKVFSSTQRLQSSGVS